MKQTRICCYRKSNRNLVTARITFIMVLSVILWPIVSISSTLMLDRSRIEFKVFPPIKYKAVPVLELVGVSLRRRALKWSRDLFNYFTVIFIKVFFRPWRKYFIKMVTTLSWNPSILLSTTNHSIAKSQSSWKITNPKIEKQFVSLYSW